MRPARALIDLQALRHNYQLARELTGAKALAVIKADAYGHGAVRVAQALEDRGRRLCRGLYRRSAGAARRRIRGPMLLLEGFFEADELPLIIEHDLWCVVHSLWQLEAIEQARLSKPLTCGSSWIRACTALACIPRIITTAYQRLLASGKVAKIVLMSHFARADELDCTSSDEQVAVFDAARQGLSAQVSLRNSPSVMGWPNVSSDWVRPGIMLYGATPFRRSAGGGRAFAAGDDPGIESHLRA
jgi:alanine racemase